MHRINTYPLIHASALHFLLNLPLAVLLLERFEAGNGTLVTVVLLAGREWTWTTFLQWGVALSDRCTVC